MIKFGKQIQLNLERAVMPEVKTVVEVSIYSDHGVDLAKVVGTALNDLHYTLKHYKVTKYRVRVNGVSHSVDYNPITGIHEKTT